MVSVLVLGAIAGAMFSGRVADRFGRRPTLAIPRVVFARKRCDSAKDPASSEPVATGWRALGAPRVRPVLVVGLTLAAVQQFAGRMPDACSWPKWASEAHRLNGMPANAMEGDRK